MRDFPVTRVVATLDDMASEAAITVGDGVRRFGMSGFETLLLVPAILLVSPLSGIPLFSTFCGVVIFLIAAQGALGRQHLWLPDRVMRQELTSDQIRRATRSLRWVADKLDRITRQRLHHLVGRPARRLVLGLCAVVAPLFPVLEFIPFSASILGGAISLFALALLARDGLMVIAGFLVLGGAAALPFTVVAAVVSP